MTKQELTRDIKNTTGNAFPTISDLARYLGSGRDYIRDLVYGLDYIETGRAKKYYAGDVAERILQRRGV